MSLTMMALRIAAIKALKAGGTLVGDNVLDSQISAFDHTAKGGLQTDQQRPFIAVYTDAAKADDLGQAGLRGNGVVDILFNTGVAMTMTQTNRDTGASEIMEGFPATDAHFEAVLDVLEWQLGRVLSDPDNPWADVFRGFVLSYAGKHHVRSSSAADQVRLAAGQTRLRVEVFADPRPGQPMDPEGPWGRFLALMEAEAVPQLVLFQMALADASEGAYPAAEQLLAMPVADAEALQLYTFGGVARDVTLSDPSGAAVPVS
ncbi:hypothetical protein KM176_05595 [Pseudooceanicola sp. CBS1P-1]|uniref:Uncharacterized protein n=1 Tax=Pseudooceanicola albus TaxID=2692189 RepID=A0A6L7FWW9_9RHOB|nr:MULTISPECIES: hypothetical protein [Pseudooceanicola]MBT9383326.1 hypothetical protein [Pseudooceanicola endophyticus]MXN16351.1 hypothetical protein [Pseudooceanicola albus]